MRLYDSSIVYNMAAPATSQQATELLEDESLAEEVLVNFLVALSTFFFNFSIFWYQIFGI